MKLFKLKNKKAFTLLELLVVIAIIGVLASIVMASLNSARVKTRNTVRKQDMTTIYKMLSLYYDKYGYLPTTATYGGEDAGGWDFSSQGTFLNFLITGGITTKVPVDPINNDTGHFVSGTYAYNYYCYNYGTANQDQLAIGYRDEGGSGVIWYTPFETGWDCQ